MNSFRTTFVGGKRMEACCWVGQSARWGRGNIGSVSQHYMIPGGWNSGSDKKLGDFLLIYLILDVCFINQSSLV